MEPNYYPQSDFPENEGVDIKRYISLFISNWYWFAITLFISLSIAYAINRYSERIYLVSSKMLIKDDQLGGNIAGAEAFIPGGDYFKTRQSLKNELGILKSYTLNKRVIDSLPEFRVGYIAIGRRNIVESRMYNESPFIVIPDTGNTQTPGTQFFIRIESAETYKMELNGDSNIEREMRFGEVFNERGFSFIINLRKPDSFEYNPDLSNKYMFSFVSPENLANQYRSNLVISPIEEDASLVNLSLSGPVPTQAADYLNMLMAIYLQQGLDLKNETAEKTIEFIDKQLDEISGSLGNAEDKLESFRLTNSLVDLSREGYILQDRLERYENEKTGLELQKNYYEYLSAYLVSKSETGDLISPTVMGVSDPQLISMVQDLAQLQQKRRELAMNLATDATPLALIDRNIDEIKKAINENVSGGLRSLESSISDVNKRIGLLEDDINKLPGTEKQMINIQREFDVNNTVYTYLLEKRAEAGIAKASNVSDNRVIDNAYVFNRMLVSPKARSNYLIALILGFLMPGIGIILIDFLNNKIIDRRDIERGTNAPILGYISHNSLKTEVPVTESPGSSLAESFRAVRTNLKYFLKDIESPVISISSTISSEGKTFISANLAAIIASLGKKVLLIGLDLRKPRIHKIFGVDNKKGISNYLIGEEEFNDIIVKTHVENLWYAPAGPVPPNPAELIESAEMKKFIELAKKEYDYIVIDTPPVAIVTDALLVSPIVDFYVFVVRQRYTSKETLGLIEELHKSENIKSLGVLINDVSITGYYGYGLRYGYSIVYGYSYGYNYYGSSYYGKYGYVDKPHGYYKDEV